VSLAAQLVALLLYPFLEGGMGQELFSVLGIVILQN
jgi:hypothetical protein